MTQEILVPLGRLVPQESLVPQVGSLGNLDQRVILVPLVSQVLMER